MPMKLFDPDGQPLPPAAMNFVAGEDGRLAKDITPTFTRRISTNIPDLDKVFGYSKRYDDAGNVVSIDWGMAVGKVYLLYGQAGTGKTTLYVQLLIKLIEEQGLRVGLGMMEMSAREVMEFIENMYKALGIKPVRLYENLVIFDGTDHVLHCARLKELKLDWMIWDSYSMFDGSGSEKGAKKIVRDIKAAIEGRCCGMIVGHLDEDGKVRGHKKVVDLADSLFVLENCPLLPYETRFDWTNRMTLRGKKNRGGASDELMYLFRYDETLRFSEGYQREPDPQLSLTPVK